MAGKVFNFPDWLQFTEKVSISACLELWSSFFCVTVHNNSLDWAVKAPPGLPQPVCLHLGRLHSYSWPIFLSLCCRLMSLLLFPRFSVCLVPSEPALMSALPGACHIRRGNNPWNDCSLFLTLLLSIPVSPLFPHSPPLTFLALRHSTLHLAVGPRTSQWCRLLSMCAHAHTHTQTLMSRVIILVWLDLCVCAGKHLIWRTDEVCVPNLARGRLNKQEEHVQFH